MLTKLVSQILPEAKHKKGEHFSSVSQELSFNARRLCGVQNCQRLEIIARSAAFDQERSRRISICKDRQDRNLKRAQHGNWLLLITVLAGDSTYH